MLGAGEAAAARVAWIRAGRIRPRDRMVRDALRLVPAVDAHARSRTWIAPVTTSELLTAGGVLWLAGWLIYAVSRRLRHGLPWLVAAALLAGFGGYLGRRYAEPTALVVMPNAALRQAPYGTAPAPTRFRAGTAVTIEKAEGAWLLVRRGDTQGWMLADEVGRV